MFMKILEMTVDRTCENPLARGSFGETLARNLENAVGDVLYKTARVGTRKVIRAITSPSPTQLAQPGTIPTPTGGES